MLYTVEDTLRGEAHEARKKSLGTNLIFIYKYRRVFSINCPINEKSQISTSIYPTYMQAFFYTHPGGPWHALFLPGTHFLSFTYPVGTRGIFPYTCQLVIIIVFIKLNGISDGIFSIFVLFSFPSSVFL